jgi:hypothetical protein
LNETVAPEVTLNPDPVTVYVAPTGPWLGLSAIAGTVTVNVPVSDWPPTSVAMTVVPEVPLGTENVQLNAPVPPAVREPLVQLEIVSESNTTDPTAVETENPVPETVTVAPTGPWVGLTTMSGMVTMKAPVPIWPPVSVAVTAVPEVPLGTLNVQEKLPPTPAVSEPLVQLEIVLASNINELSTVDTEKPVPATVTVAPMGPWPGVTVIAGIVTVNTPVGLWPPTSVAVTVVPDVPLGTRNVHEKLPVGPVVNEPLVQLEIVTESNTNDARRAETENPVPDTITVAPIGPCIGLSVIDGTVTRNDPVAVWPPTSVAVTVEPEVPEGTAKVQLNAPEPSVVNEPLEQPETVTESSTREERDADTENPVPVTVTVAPSGPCEGLIAMAGTVTENAPVPCWPPISVAVTTVPEVLVGTEKVQVNAPEPSVASEPLVQLEIGRLSKTNEASGVETEKPDPETVTVAPTGPWAGVTVVVGVVTVNVCGAVEVAVATSWPTTALGPALTLGTVKVQTKPPVPSVVMVVPTWEQSDPPLGVWSTEWNDTVAPDVTLNPEPVAV